MKLFSNKNRPFHLGPYPLERLARQPHADLGTAPPFEGVSYAEGHGPESLGPAMGRYMAMLDIVRDGEVAPIPAEIPDDPQARSDHLKAAGYYYDATQVAVCALPPEAILDAPLRNPMIPVLAAELERDGPPHTHFPATDMVFADVMACARRELGPVTGHRFALVFLIEYARDPRPGEPGTEWIVGSQAQRAGVLGANAAVLLSSYLRDLGYDARAHTVTTSDVDLNKLAIASGLAVAAERNGERVLENPYVGRRFGLAAVTTSLDLRPDLPLAPRPGMADRWKSHGPAWWLGTGAPKSALNHEPYARRDFHMGAYPFETLKRRDDTTTFIDEPRVPRVPSRGTFFARAAYGDLGKEVQDQSKGGFYLQRSALGACARRVLGALLLLQFGGPRGAVSPTTSDPERNALNIKGAAYYMATDAVGLSRCPEWVYYSHDAVGRPITDCDPNAITLLYDQGHDTFSGSSGDDWVSSAQSMRGYLRFSLLGGILGEHLRRLGYAARVHSVLDDDVIMPPLLLLSGLGEASRIGDVILNPFLGPRLKSGVVTTTMPFTHDKPIDFGLQTFCNSCNKCARECPSGAISAGPKVMFNGYEVWKTDAEKCTRYRMTNQGGSMCGRCMKACPWNLEGLFTESALRWIAMRWPKLAPILVRLDDWLGRGTINPVKT
jgi:reductive dehalogenase